MSEEEKESALIFLKGIVYNTDYKNSSNHYYKDILNIIEQQKKEIEELKAGIYETSESYKLKKRELELYLQQFNKNYISRDKIEDKMEELEKEIEEKQEYGCDFTLIHEHEIDTNAIIRVLKELLGEE